MRIDPNPRRSLDRVSQSIELDPSAALAHNIDPPMTSMTIGVDARRELFMNVHRILTELGQRIFLDHPHTIALGIRLIGTNTTLKIISSDSTLEFPELFKFQSTLVVD